VSVSIPYHYEDGLWGRFVSHAQLGLSKEIQPHRHTIPEILGDAILWTWEDLPNIVWEKVKDARIVTIVMTALSLLANSFLFYPVRTWLKVKAFYHWLPLPPLWAVRFASYIYSCALITGYGLRAFGRFSNQRLMHEFYHSPAKA
jgi:hypothetical protein